MTMRIPGQSNACLATDLTSHAPDEASESRVDAPPTPPTAEQFAAQVKVAERGSFEARRTLAFVHRNADPGNGMTPREVGACKTVVTGNVALAGALAAAALFKHPVAIAMGGAGAKMVGDGVASLVCDPPEVK